MLIDARQLPADTEIDCDVCVVGSGAAGITIARELAGQAFKVCLLESGGLDLEEDTQQLYAGDSGGFPVDLDVSRLRYFGGTTNHWAGGCHPLPASVMDKRPWIPHSGWPISRADLDPYYDRAAPIVQIDTNDFTPERWRDELPELYKLPLFGEGKLEPGIWQFSPPTRFARTYRADLERAETVTVYLHANVVDIETNDTANTVTGLRVACLDGKRFRVRGKLFVLATGGIENARLLLAANTVQTAGLGNGHDLVGRYFADHINFIVARIALNEPSDAAATPASALGKISTRLLLSDAVTEQEQLTHFVAVVAPAQDGGGRGPGYHALRRLTKRIRHGEMPQHLWRDLYNMVSDIGGLIGDLSERFGDASVLELYSDAETIPDPDNRVTLAAERDALGMPRARIHWRFSADDKRNWRRALEVVGAEFGRAGLGRLQAHDWLLSDSLDDFPGDGSNHHMGTTRMAADPKEGVVDADCRVHGIGNLYVAGSSVFPSWGVATPTFSLIALAIRLADHIKAHIA
jgi:choline dehydrogenase-like flavoprotein